MFDALANLSTCIPDAYNRASEFDDLHLADLHLIQLDGCFLYTSSAIITEFIPPHVFSMALRKNMSARQLFDMYILLLSYLIGL